MRRPALVSPGRNQAGGDPQRAPSIVTGRPSRTSASAAALDEPRSIPGCMLVTWKASPVRPKLRRPTRSLVTRAFYRDLRSLSLSLSLTGGP